MCEDVKWVAVDQDFFQWWAFVSMATILRVPPLELFYSV